jgi:hypothetical protein
LQERGQSSRAALVQAIVRFVGEHEVRRMYHCAGYRHTLLHTTAQRSNGRICALEHRHAAEGILDSALEIFD